MAVTREKMKKEALVRMKILGLHENALKDLEHKDIVNSSFFGALYFLDDGQKARVRQFEDESGGLVYHVIHDYTDLGEMLSFLYVSKYEDEWSRDREDLKEGIPLVYVANLTDEMCSEYGSIGVKPYMDGVLRIF
mgnify:CR=1 FL=1